MEEIITERSTASCGRIESAVRKNAMTSAMLHDLADILNDAARDASHCLLLARRRAIRCAGNDIEDF